jgi:hypothetical protein
MKGRTGGSMPLGGSEVMSKCRFTIPTSTIGLGATYKRHQYEDGKCKRCGKIQVVKVKKEETK